MTEHATIPNLPPSRRWLHRWAALSVCATLPLILLGGSVTSFNAGMVAPDYPTTFGQSLLAFFFQMWDQGRDLILEHGHRTYGALVGLLTVVLAGWTWLADPRRSVRWLAGAALAGVIVQGLLGGLRVVLVERGLAFVHGLAAQAFFALLVCFATVTAPGWIARRRHAPPPQPSPTRGEGVRKPSPSTGEDTRNPSPLMGEGRVGVTDRRRLDSIQHAPRRSLILLILVGAQLPLGALLRHTHWEMHLPSAKAAALALHGVLALLILYHALALAIAAHRTGDVWLRRPATALVALIVLQALLGTLTWAASTQIGVNNLVEPTLAEAAFGTLHVAVAALILATACLFALRCRHSAPSPLMAHRSRAPSPSMGQRTVGVTDRPHGPPPHPSPATGEEAFAPERAANAEPLTRLAAGVDQ